MYRIKFAGFLTVFLFLIFTCSEDTPLEPPSTGNIPANFSEIQEQVFDVRCATAGCHAGNNPASNLNLTEGNSYDQLVGVTSMLKPTLNRVEANNSEESVLVQILRGDITPRMPFGGTPLSEATIDSIAKWIDEGALNN